MYVIFHGLVSDELIIRGLFVNFFAQIGGNNIKVRSEAPANNLQKTNKTAQLKCLSRMTQ